MGLVRADMDLQGTSTIDTLFIGASRADMHP